MQSQQMLTLKHNRLSELTSMNPTDVSAEVASDEPLYFPPAVDASVVRNKRIRCIAFELQWNDTRMFFVMSVDCDVTKGEGSTILGALEDFKIAVECVVIDGTGGLFLGISSDEFLLNFYKNLESDWSKDGVKILSKSLHDVRIFAA